VRDRDWIERARTLLDGFLAGAVPSQVDGDGLQDRIGHQLGERGGCAHNDLVRGAHPWEIQTPDFFELERLAINDRETVVNLLERSFRDAAVV
jgi:hypothetical protein